MATPNFLIKSASLTFALIGGLLLAASPVTAEMEESQGDFGTTDPDGPSVEALGDNTGEIDLPEENTTPAFESENGGDFGSNDPDGLSIEALGDNTGEVILPRDEGTRDPEDTDNETEYSPDYGTSDPEGADIDNFGENDSVF